MNDTIIKKDGSYYVDITESDHTSSGWSFRLQFKFYSRPDTAICATSRIKKMSTNYNTATSGSKHQLGSMKGQKFIADGHDIDEYNDEIARLFFFGGWLLWPRLMI